MAREWRVFAHPDYFISFRSVVIDPDERFLVTKQLMEYLKTIDDPSKYLTRIPGELDQYECLITRYAIIVQWKKEYPDDIRLLEIYLAIEE